MLMPDRGGAGMHVRRTVRVRVRMPAVRMLAMPMLMGVGMAAMFAALDIVAAAHDEDPAVDPDDVDR